MILNIIEQARKGAAVASARSYIKAVETYTVLSEFKKEKISLKSNNTYNVTTTTTVEDKTYNAMNDLVEIKGSLPIGNEDYIKIEENNQVEEALLTINGYVILIRDGEVISITKGSIISVESIALNKENAIIGIDETLKLEATILPDNAANKIVTWTTSDKSIASVDNNGLVAGIKIGTVTITAKTSNGKTATANIIVSSISAKKDVDTNIEHGTNKNIVSTYFDVGNTEKVICKVGNIEVNSTDDIAEKVGINNTYKVECSSATGSASIDLKVANKLYLYKDGNEFTNITGGFVKADAWTSGTLYKTSVLTLTAPSCGNNCYVMALTKNSFNLGKYSKFSVNVTASTKGLYGNYGYVGAYSSNSSAYNNSGYAGNTIQGIGLYEVNLANLTNTNAYIGFYTADAGSNSVDKIWLEM